MTTPRRRRPATRKLTLAQRVLIVEKHIDGMLTQCQLEIDTRLKAVEKKVEKR